MNTIQDIENAILKLPADDLVALRAWFAAFDADAWDRQFEQDVVAGRLDALADEALNDLRDGQKERNGRGKEDRHPADPVPTPFSYSLEHSSD